MKNKIILMVILGTIFLTSCSDNTLPVDDVIVNDEIVIETDVEKEIETVSETEIKKTVFASVEFTGIIETKDIATELKLPSDDPVIVFLEKNQITLEIMNIKDNITYIINRLDHGKLGEGKGFMNVFITNYINKTGQKVIIFAYNGNNYKTYLKDDLLTISKIEIFKTEIKNYNVNKNGEFIDEQGNIILNPESKTTIIKTVNDYNNNFINLIK